MATKKKTAKKKPLKVPAGDAPASPAKGTAVEAGADTEPPEAPPQKATSRGDDTTQRVAVPRVRLAKSGRLDREVVVDAVYLEALERGMSKRDALAAAEDVADRLRLPCEPGPVPDDMPFFDLRGEQDFIYPDGKNKVRKRGNAVVRRDLADVDTLVVHQAGAEYGVSKRAIANAGGDVELARARRALDVACHVMAFRQGYFVAAHDLDVYVNHAGRFNAKSYCLEIDGRYPGLADDPDTAAREDLRTTWGGDPTTLTDDTVRAACDAVEWIFEEAIRRGGGIKKVKGHRQSSDTRRSDPGEEIWRRVVLDFARDQVGLEVVRESPWRKGRPVPVAWDPDGIGSY